MRRLMVGFILLAGVLASPVMASALDERIEAFNDSANTQTQAQVLGLIKLGIQEQRSAEALAAVQAWLNRNHLADEDALFHAGQACERSGQWLPAVGYYQRLLQSPKPDAKRAGPAVDGVYRLLLGVLDDPNTAYLYMQKEGDRLRRFGHARRYDRWFLDQARKRRHLVAVSDRLAEIAGDKAVPLDRFDDDLKWLCTELEHFRKEDPAVYESAAGLASQQRLAEGYQARLRWAWTVMPYNFKLDELRAANAPADPKLSDAPLAAAAALIKAEPDLGTLLVAKAWGTEYDHGHSGNCARRFEVAADRKLKQLLDALPKMSVASRDDLLATRIAQGRVKFDPLAIYQAVLKYPDSFNRLDVANAPSFDKGTLTVELAKQLAPHLSRNPHPDAAMVRAIAASGSLEFGAIADAMIKSEAWRFKNSKDALDWAWRASTTQEAQLKALQKQYAKPSADDENIAKQTGKDAASAQRLAAFNTLYKDLLAPSPSIASGLVLWDDLFANAPDEDLAQMIKAMVADTSGQRGVLLKRALEKARFGKKDRGSMLWQAQVYDNQFRYHRTPVQEAVPGLIEHLQGMIAKQVKAGAIDPVVFGMWLHTVDPAEDDARQLIQDLLASPAYQKLDPAYHAAVADNHHFGLSMATPAIVQQQPGYPSRELLALGQGADAKQVERALAAVIKRVSSSHEAITVVGLEPVASLDSWSDETRRHVLSLFLENAPLGEYPNKQGYEPLVERLADDAREQQRWGELEPYIAGLWRAAAAKDHHTYSGVANLVRLTEAALESGQTSLAISLARSGLASRVGQSLTASTNETYSQWAGRLSQVQGKASIAIGIINIPVDERDPAFPIYKSQSEFATGNTAAAWELYDENAGKITPIIRELTVPYCLWLLEREIEAEQGDRAEALIRELTIWSREAAGTFTPEQEAELKIAYADAALQKGALQTAKAWYRRVADAEAYQGTRLQHKAMLRSVNVDRVSKDFGSAMAELDKLMLVRDEQLRLQVHYARAEVYFAQENYAEAFGEVSTVLKRDPSHADALILLGKAQLEMRKLVDASEIELGVTRDQRLVVPGEVIKINLSDPALNVSGVGADIEVEIWTESGDRERVMLYQLGDDKTKFRAEVPTALAPRTPGDKVLQVLGRDEIRYGYSKRFREKMKDLPPDPEVVITVASDARLAITAGAFPPREGERRLDLEELGVSSAQQALGTRRVRPGNPVYIRVTDPDQGKTDQIDQVLVSLQTSNGDTIPRLVLKETGTHTGEFQAAVPTSAAQALAYASETMAGRDANMVISSKDYPGWSGAVGSKADYQLFTVDLNDNVDLDQLTIRCDDPSQSLTHFVVQTSMNGEDWVSRARYPSDPAPWDGRPQVSAFPTYNRNAIAVSQAEGPDLPEDWHHKMEIASAAPDIAYGAFTVKGLDELGGLELPSGGHPGYSVLVRYRALFYQPAAAIRTFRLAGLPAGEKTQTLLLLDGEPAAPGEGPLMIERELGPGLHTIEVWRHEARSELLKRKPALLCDAEGEAELRPCPSAMFDPATFPEPVREQIPQATGVVSPSDAPTTFNIRFGERTRARLVRLAIVGHQGPTPAIHKITLTDRAGQQRLPVQTDYQQLRANQQLEVVPGDRVTVRYEDDRVVSPRRSIQQAGLSVAYNTATISASFLTYLTTEQGRELVLEPIRRFKLDDSVGIVINDPDMDQTAEPDTVDFTVKSSGGAVVTLKALETGPHTGEFLGRVFPVSSEPKRESEVLVPVGGTLTASYRDSENLDPGIPTDRVVTIEHARYSTPTLSVYSVESEALPALEPNDQADEDERGPEVVVPRRILRFVDQASPDDSGTPPNAVIGSTLRFDVVATHLAFAQSSEIFAYVQTESGRRVHRERQGGAGASAFDVRVPGTLKLAATPSRSAPIMTPAGYDLVGSASPLSAQPPLDEGRFAFAVPLVLGDIPTRSFATQDAESLPSSMRPDGLAVRPGEKVYVGFAYLDPQGKARWLTREIALSSDSFLDVMNGRYRRDITAAFVGEKLYVRLIAPELDKGPGRDEAVVRLKAESGADVSYPIRESEAHSGVFKGSFALSYASEPTGDKLPPVMLHGLPVKYGDTVTVSFPGGGTDTPAAIRISVNKGADGVIEPFSKRYGEDAVAVQTTFTMAECFFELAKHHRKMDQESLARREMGQAQKLLAEAVETHRDASLQAHAEYLLGNLAQEYADLSKNQASKKAMYQDALARFTKIPLDYPDTEFAPKAQFKKALVYEKLGEVDIAVEEYVKLAYKYPDHELIPSVMSRLGSYFQAQGLAHKKEAEALEKLEDDAEAQGEAIRLRELATKQYLNAAQVFKKLEERFPTDVLAGLAGLRSGQNYMRAGDYEAAIAGLQKVYENQQYDDKQVRSQAMFWAGISYERSFELQEAYELYRRVTFDFPDSVWAKQSRGRLADPAFARIIELENLARERMLEGLKEEDKKRR